MLLEKTFPKIRFLKFLENQLLILVFKATTVQYLLMDKQDQGRRTQFKVSIKHKMGLHLIKELPIQKMIKEEFFQDSLNIYLQK